MTARTHAVSRLRFWALVAIQLVALLLMIAWRGSIHLLPGETLILRTVPVDPRSLFMGDYVILDYEISDLEPASGVRFEDWEWPEGSAAYVRLEVREDGTAAATEVLHDPPSEGLFIKGRVDWFVEDRAMYLDYGIEEYYIPENTGGELEEWVTAGRILVTVKVDVLGRTAIVDLDLQPLAPGESVGDDDDDWMEPESEPGWDDDDFDDEDVDDDDLDDDDDDF